MPPPLWPFKGIVFDLDDTLITSPLDFPRLKAEIGAPAESYVLEHIAMQPESMRSELMAIVERHELEAAYQAKWLPGAQDALAVLQEKNMPMAILTRNRRHTTELIVQRLGIPIPLVLTREDCAPKPAPDGLLRISQHWNMPPAQLLFVGDHIIDMQAATNAGMAGCLVADEHAPIEHGTLRVQQLDELIAHLFGS